MITLTVLLIAVPLILLTALFTKKGISTSATIDINQPQQRVFDYLSQLKNLQADPKLRAKFSQRIVGLTANERIAIEIIFEKPLRSKAIYYFDLEPIAESSTRVNCCYEGNPSPHYLLRVAHLLLRLEKKVHQYMQTKLQNLKTQLEH
jgi:hypothetical protein